MEFFCGLDVSIEETAVCVLDDKGGYHRATPSTGTRPRDGSPSRIGCVCRGCLHRQNACPLSIC